MERRLTLRLRRVAVGRLRGVGMETVYHKIIITTRPESASFAMGELQNYDRGIRPVGDLAVGVKEIYLPGGYGKLLADAPPLIFVRHMFPVQYFAVGEYAAADILAGVAIPDDGGAFSVQMRGDTDPGLIRRLENALEERNYVRDDRYPRWVLSLYAHEGGLYAGASRCGDNRSAWNGGTPRYKRADFISRAECKLMEAMETFGLRPRPHARALDLGAAPGGWSKVLLEAGFHVTAVDPGALDKRLAHHPRLSYVCATAQRFLAARDKAEIFDAVVNDMKMDMYDSVRVMLDAAPFLAPGGVAVMTLKLAKGQGLRKINKALALLEKKYRVGDTRQLFHNRDEVTVLLYRLSGPAAP